MLEQAGGCPGGIAMLLLVIFARSTCPVLCLWLRSPWSPKDTHSIPPAWMPSLTLQGTNLRVADPQGEDPSLSTKTQPLERLASGNVSDKKAHLHICIQPVAHLRSAALLFGSVGWFSSQTCSCPPVWRSYVLQCLWAFSLTAQLSLILAQIKQCCPIEDEEVQPGAHTPQTGLLLIL